MIVCLGRQWCFYYAANKFLTPFPCQLHVSWHQQSLLSGPSLFQYNLLLVLHPPASLQLLLSGLLDLALEDKSVQCILVVISLPYESPARSSRLLIPDESLFSGLLQSRQIYRKLLCFLLGPKLRKAR